MSRIDAMSKMLDRLTPDERAKVITTHHEGLDRHDWSAGIAKLSTGNSEGFT